MKFSIMVPVFKTKYLKESIKSILGQRYQDFEVIIVNDKSPEDVSLILNQFDDPRITYYENEVNLGSSNVVLNWNKCLSYATGEFGLLFSDDDFLDPEFISEISLLIDKYPNVDLFYSRVGVVDSENQLLRYTPSAPEYETVFDFIWHRFSGLREMYAQNFVFRVEKLKKINGFVNFPLAWASDDATWFSLAADNGVVSTNKPLCFWRYSELNISNIGSVEIRLSAIDQYFIWLDNFLKTLTPANKFEKDIRNSIDNIKARWKSKLKHSLINNLFKNNNYLKAITILFRIRKRNYFSYKFVVKSSVRPVLDKLTFK